MPKGINKDLLVSTIMREYQNTHQRVFDQIKNYETL